MHHLTPPLSSRIFTPSFIPPYTFLFSSPTTCLLHVASNVALNRGVERACIHCRHDRTICPKTKKAPLKMRNVDLANMHVASNVALNRGVERACIHFQEKRDKSPNTGNMILRHCFRSKSRHGMQFTYEPLTARKPAPLSALTWP